MYQAKDGPRIALYSHDTVGLGHTRRNLRIAEALGSRLQSSAILLITGSRASSAFRAPQGVDFLTLPSLAKDPGGGYRPRHLGLPVEELRSIRAGVIQVALEAFDPDVLIVDKVPRGSLCELDPTLESLASRGKTHLVLGLRDVLDDAEAVRRDWARDRGGEAVADFYDEVWVYGDPTVFRMSTATGVPPIVQDKARYTGYVAPAPANLHHGSDRRDARPGRRFVLCQVGGGEDGVRLADVFAQTRRPDDLDGVLLAGPYMPPSARKRLHGLAARDPGLHVIDFDPDPLRLIRDADRVVSMGGYNSVCEILALGKHALVVPRVSPRREQLIRAERLDEIGVVDCLHPDRLGVDTMGEWLSSSLSGGRDRRSIDLCGLRRIPGYVSGLLGRANSHFEGRPTQCASAM